jgi:hypothetical protein
VSSVTSSPNKKPVVHDMRGGNGYPVMMIAMNDNWRELLVHHWKADVQVGHLMIVGENAMTARTYLVVRNEPNPDKHNLHRRSDGWWAGLVIATIPVTVGGDTYC